MFKHIYNSSQSATTLGCTYALLSAIPFWRGRTHMSSLTSHDRTGPLSGPTAIPKRQNTRLSLGILKARNAYEFTGLSTGHNPYEFICFLTMMIRIPMNS